MSKKKATTRDAGTPESGCSDFICFDWCGWNDRYGRFTHMPSGDTIVCAAWMGQTDWDKAQLEWFRKFGSSIIVHECLQGPYRETGFSMGSVAEIIQRLESRLNPNPSEHRPTGPAVGPS